MPFKKVDKKVKTINEPTVKVGFTANNNNRLELTGCKIKYTEFTAEQEMSSIENTRTILDPDTGNVIGIEKNIIHTVTIKLIPEKADDNNAPNEG